MGNLSKTAAIIDEVLNGTRRSVTAQESAILGAELASADGWVLGANWAGSFAGGFTHTAGSVETLTFPITASGTKRYLVEFDTNTALANNELFIQLGNSEQYDLYNGGTHYSCGITSVSNGNLVFTPVTGFAKTISNITIKEVTAISTPVKIVKESGNTNAYEERTSLTALENFFIGLRSGQYNSKGYQNVGVGTGALENNSSGFWNVGIGTNALNKNTVGSRNLALGYKALEVNISGYKNQALGTYALVRNTTGYLNTSIGVDTLFYNTTGYQNIAIGGAACYSNTTGNTNIGIGVSALNNNVISSNNIAIGYYAAYKTTAAENMAIGRQALYQNVAGVRNVAIGYQAGLGSAAGDYSYNTLIGCLAGLALTTNGNRNTIIGYYSGQTLTTGNTNILIGYQIDVPSASTSNYLNIGGLITGVMSGAKKVTIDGALKATLATYVDNAAAITGGLAAGDFYKTVTGELRIVV